MSLDLLVFGAHPDDVEISCGGLVHRMATLGHRVGICDFTRGEMGTRGDVATRAAEAEEARGILGAEVRINLGLPDTRLSAVEPSHMEAVVKVLREHRPRLVVAPYWVDQHPDHEEASKLVTRATFLAGLGKYPPAGSGRFRPVAVVYTMFRRPFETRFIVDISASLEAKLHSVAAHRSQTYAPPGDPNPTRLTRSDFLDNLRARARFYGGRIGVDYGEAFTTREEVAVDDPVTAFTGARADRLLG